MEGLVTEGEMGERQQMGRVGTPTLTRGTEEDRLEDETLTC